MGVKKLGVVLGCLGLVGCPAATSGDTDTDGDTESEGTTSDPSTTLPPPTTATMSGTTTTDPSTTQSTESESEAESMPATESDTTGDPGMGCCDVHPTPQCDEPMVNECTCTELPDCCVFEWDELCVEVAMNDCAATCMGTDTDTAGTTTGPGDCELQQIELVVEDATLTGSWIQSTSMVGEGEIAFLPPPNIDGSVVWTVPIPCQDTWLIWVRYFDGGAGDSYFATLDAEPDPPAIFEGDCTAEPFGGGEYGWSLLNHRDNSDPDNPAPPCEYIEDPWTADWDAGDHDVEFSYRPNPPEARAIGRIIVTNDPDFAPE